MAKFIDFQVGIEEEIGEDDKVSDSDLDSLSSFTENEETDNDVSFYRSFNNAHIAIGETLKVEYDEISNFCESSEDEAEIDDCDTSAEQGKNFRESLLQKSNSDEVTVHNNFIRVVLYALKYEKK